MLVVVPVGVVLGGGGLGAQHVRVAAVVVAARVHLEAGLLVVVVLEDLLQRDDSGNGQGDFTDHQRLAGDRGQSLQSQRSGDSHGGQQGGHHVTSVLLASLAATAAAAATTASELLLAYTEQRGKRVDQDLIQPNCFSRGISSPQENPRLPRFSLISSILS